MQVWICFTAAYHAALQMATPSRKAALQLLNVIRYVAFGGEAGVSSFLLPHSQLIILLRQHILLLSWWAAQIQDK